MALDVATLTGPLEVVDRHVMCGRNPQRLAGTARGLAVRRPAQHEFRRAIEARSEHLEGVPRMEVLDERRQTGEGRVMGSGDGPRPAPRSNALSAPIAWPERRT